MLLNPAENPQIPRWLLAGAGVLVVALAFYLDEAIDGYFFLPPHQNAWEIAWWVSKLGDWPPILLAGAVLTLVLGGRRKLAASRMAWLILAAGLLTGFMGTAVRSAVGRTRPLAAAPQGFYGVWYQGKWIGGKYDFGSFPSGHTATWAGLAGAAWFRRRRPASVFLAVTGVVAWSRVALGCHHFSDVTASIIFGLLAGGWLYRWLGAMMQVNCDRNYDAATSA